MPPRWRVNTDVSSRHVAPGQGWRYGSSQKLEWKWQTISEWQIVLLMWQSLSIVDEATENINKVVSDYTLITNLMHWLLFTHKILFSSTCFEHQVLIFRSSHSSCVSTGHQDSYREWRYHMLLVYNYVLLKMSTGCSKHVQENSILWINNNQCIKLVINI